MQVAKWGNSLAIRLPASVVLQLGLKEGDDIEVIATNEKVFEVAKKANSLDAIATLKKYQGCLPADFKFDRDATHER